MSDLNEPIFVQFAEDIFNSTDSSDMLINHTQTEPNTHSPLQKVKIELRKNRNCLGIGHLNASSVPKHIDEIRKIVCGITESFIKDDVPEDRTTIKGYKLLNVNRTDTTQGGLALYLREQIEAKQLNIPQNANLPELMCAVITINNIEIAVAVLYKRPVISYKKLDDIIDHITQFTCTYDETIIMGDINIDQLNRYSPDYKYFNTNIMEPLSFTQVIDKPTRITEHSRHCIDIIMVNNRDKCINYGVAPTYSDHHLVYMSYDVQKPDKIA